MGWGGGGHPTQPAARLAGPAPPQVRCRSDLRFSIEASVGIEATDGGTVLARTADDPLLYAARMTPGFGTAGRTYLEVEVLELHGGEEARFMLGATSVEGPPHEFFDPATAWLYHCGSALAFPGGRGWGAPQRRLAPGARIGALVDGGRLWIRVDGEWVGPGPMARGLPAKVWFASTSESAAAAGPRASRAEHGDSVQSGGLPPEWSHGMRGAARGSGSRPARRKGRRWGVFLFRNSRWGAGGTAGSGPRSSSGRMGRYK